MSRSSKPIVIKCYRSPITPQIPSFVALGHRRLEKEIPPTPAVEGDTISYPIPVDLMRVSGFPDSMVENVEEISIEYKKKG